MSDCVSTSKHAAESDISRSVNTECSQVLTSRFEDCHMSSHAHDTMSHQWHDSTVGQLRQGQEQNHQESASDVTFPRNSELQNVESGVHSQQVGSSENLSCPNRCASPLRSYHVDLSEAQAVPSSAGRPVLRGAHQGHLSDGAGGSGKRGDILREGEDGSSLQNSLRRQPLDRLVCLHFRDIDKGESREVCGLREQETGCGNQSRSDRAQGNQECGQTSVSEDHQDRASQDASLPEGRDRWRREPERVHPHHGNDIPCGGTDADHARGKSESQGPHDQHRDGDPRADPACEEPQPRQLREARMPDHDHTVLQVTHADDDLDYVFQIPIDASAETFRSRVQKLVKQYRLELKSIQDRF